jgi:type IV secretory pathway VirB4 component
MPMTLRQHQASLHEPAFCELLPVRDFLDNVIVRSNGAFVAGYELGGINSYYHSDDARNATKFSFEALVRSLAERSMRMQVRFETVEGLGDLPTRYKGQLRSDHSVIQALDRLRLASWKHKERSGFYLHSLIHAYFYWDPRVHHEAGNSAFGNKLNKAGKTWSMSAEKCIQRTRRQHDDLLSEFESILRGVEHTPTATGMAMHRLSDDELFLEVKRALNPLLQDELPYRPPEFAIDYRSAREQASMPSGCPKL